MCPRLAELQAQSNMSTSCHDETANAVCFLIVCKSEHYDAPFDFEMVALEGFVE